jgi:RNA polymerase sigma-70 factor (sigma-E family)
VTVPLTTWPPPSDGSDSLGPHQLIPIVEPSFETFFRANVGAMVRLGGLITGSVAIGEEIAQEGFSSIYQRWSTLDEPVGYLRTIVVNRSRDHLRREDVARRSATKIGPPRDKTEDVYPDSDRSIFKALDRLNERQRAAVVLRYWSDLTEKEIAAVLQCRPGTVKSMLSRSLSELRKVVER